MALFERASIAIRHCLVAYEAKVSDLIVKIGRSSSIIEADKHFDELLDITENLAPLYYKHEFKIGAKLRALTFELDRLDDPEARAYWYAKFKDGLEWPESVGMRGLWHRRR